ncbi:hypothetical protein [Haloarcula litorea]|uniref:hypothetical protein n=1 Tax=Haloarcula litorea TaxID=3032579 RepID=UPI0023E756E0|nr:hypothetical protein [Halomicroarcula sp. GDY20]
MCRDRAWPTLAVVGLCLVLGGCQGVFGPGEPTRTRTVTPAPVPATETPTPEPNGRALGGAWPGQWHEFDPPLPAAAYRDLRPTCDRPPALAVRLQIGAILTDDGTGEGIETTWEFLAPSARQGFGTVSTYVDTFERRYRPLLAAESVTLRPLQRNGSVATQPLRVRTDGSTVTYRWRAERRSTAGDDGCWLTTEIRAASASDAGLG